MQINTLLQGVGVQMTKTAIARPRVLMRGGRRKGPSLEALEQCYGWMGKNSICSAPQRTGRWRWHRYKWARAAQTKPGSLRARESACVLISCARPEKGNWSGVNSRGTPDTALLEIELSAKGKEVVARHCGPQFGTRPERNAPATPLLILFVPTQDTRT
jgi:hypothetical protein